MRREVGMATEWIDVTMRGKKELKGSMPNAFRRQIAGIDLTITRYPACGGRWFMSYGTLFDLYDLQEANTQEAQAKAVRLVIGLYKRSFGDPADEV
jgi:hypothetical protein